MPARHGRRREEKLRREYAAPRRAPTPMKNWWQARDCRGRSGGNFTAELPWPAKKPPGAGAVAVWVRQREKVGPVQATGGWLAAH